MPISSPLASFMPYLRALDVRRAAMRLAFCLLIFGSLPAAQAQEQEFGVLGGAAHMTGDINNQFKALQYARPAGGIFYRNNFHSRWSWKTSLTWNRTEGADSTSGYLFQQSRNLSFRNDIIDLATGFEFNFRKQKLNKGHVGYFTPYLFFGLSVFFQNPQARYQGEWVDLRPLGTEGQQFPERTGNDAYKLFQIGVPIGGGLKWYMNANWQLGLDFRYHKTFTDYLDDVSTVYVDRSILAGGINGDLSVALADRSVEMDGVPVGEPGRQRGDSARRDGFLTVGITLSYVWTDIKCPSPGNKGF
jgi:hypothetical protein